MDSSIRSSVLSVLYPRKTDCVMEWICGLLHEEDSEEYSRIRNYFDEYLAFTEENSHLLDLYYKNSLRSIREIKKAKRSMEFFNQVFEENIVPLSLWMESGEHQKVEEAFKVFFIRCGLSKVAA